MAISSAEDSFRLLPWSLACSTFLDRQQSRSLDPGRDPSAMARLSEGAVGFMLMGRVLVYRKPKEELCFALFRCLIRGPAET